MMAILACVRGLTWPYSGHVYRCVPNRRSPPAILLRESYRDGNQVRKRTLLNLTSWPRHLVEGFRALLNGGSVIPAGQAALTIVRSLPHGHVAAVLGTLRHIGLDRLLGPDGNRCRDLAIALIVSRIIAPTSKLATGKALDPATAASSLGELLGLGAVDEDELYTALDWLLARQPAVETALAKRCLKGGTLVLYDVSSSYLEPLLRPGEARLQPRLSTPIEFSRELPDEKSLVGRVSVISRRVDRGSCFSVVDRGGVAPARVVV